jgi:hypothetical protein
MYSVTQHYTDGTSLTVRSNVEVEEAVKVFTNFTDDINVQEGKVESVTINDVEDNINLEWTYGRGITFPVELSVQQH